MTFRTRITAMTAATALVLAGTPAAMAKPDNNDILKLLAAGAAAALIYNEINKNKKRRQTVVQPITPAPKPAVNVLPARCAIDIQGSKGWEAVYSPYCLSRNGFTATLPRSCAQEIRTETGWGTVYGEYCLRQAGYQVEAWRR